jgi:hypothetical protein
MNQYMNKVIWKLGLAIAAAVIVFAPNALADNTTSMDLVSAGSNVYDNAVYIGPYYADIGGSSTATPVICDDYNDESYIPESWTAYTTNEANVATATAPLKWGDNQSLYNEMSYLANQLMANQSNPAVADAIQFAIWELGVQSAGGSITDLPLPGGSTCTGAFNATVTACWLNQAVANYASTIFSDVTIYSFDQCTNTASSPCSSTNPPQEFLVVTTPEPSTILLLVLGVGGLFLLKRRQRNAVTALAV